MIRFSYLARDRRAVGAVEFALAAPVLLVFVFGILQLGMIFQASNGLNYGLDEAARLAIVYPRPTDAAIQARLTQRKFGLDPTRLTVTLTRPTATSAYVEISASYSVPVDFVMFTGPTITLTSTRRAFQPT